MTLESRVADLEKRLSNTLLRGTIASIDTRRNVTKTGIYTVEITNQLGFHYQVTALLSSEFTGLVPTNFSVGDKVTVLVPTGRFEDGCYIIANLSLKPTASGQGRVTQLTIRINGSSADVPANWATYKFLALANSAHSTSNRPFNIYSTDFLGTLAAGTQVRFVGSWRMTWNPPVVSVSSAASLNYAALFD